MPAAAFQAIEASGVEIRNTLADAKETSGHPIELLRFAVDAVKRDRERLERELAELWVSTKDTSLFVDGGLPTGPLASASQACVGVIKSHHTIYAPGDSLPTILALEEEERSSAFVVKRGTWAPPVLSWYLRLREPPSHDPFMGLVRVEVARTADVESSAAVSRRADEVSRWILAERAPLALPDARWDRMVYGDSGLRGIPSRDGQLSGDYWMLVLGARCWCRLHPAPACSSQPQHRVIKTQLV
jgi:hypothetical protein